MADINQTITLGIGTPADIEHFILFGLNINPLEGTACVTLHERLFGVGTLEARGFTGSLHLRQFGTADLDDREFGTADLYERKFGSGTLEDKP